MKGASKRHREELCYPLRRGISNDFFFQDSVDWGELGRECSLPVGQDIGDAANGVRFGYTVMRGMEV